MNLNAFAEELRKWWSFDDGQIHTHSWHSREDFIKIKLPELLSGAKPVDQWKIVINEPVLVYVVHQNAKYEQDENKRLQDWEGWHIGQWIKHNKGGWMWHGLLGEVTHVAPLPPIPTNRGQINPKKERR